MIRLGIPGFAWADLFEPSKLEELAGAFNRFFEERAHDAYARFDAYRKCKGEGMTPEAESDALLAGAPHLSAFIAKLFGVEAELAKVHADVDARAVLWKFRHEFSKKRVLAKDPGKAWRDAGLSVEQARAVGDVALSAIADAKGGDEELAVAAGTVALLEIDDVARKAKKHGGAHWTDALHVRAKKVGDALRSDARTSAFALPDDEACVARALDAIETVLAERRKDHQDQARRWPSLRQPHTLDFQNLVQIRRPDEKLPELFVGPPDERRQRGDFRLTDKRGSAREAEQEIDYCLYCHERDKDSCSKGLHEKDGSLKKNPLRVELRGCPLGEKISEMHVMRRDGDPLAALALVTVDNPMCAGTGHRICNDCMKACVFQKQEPVNIPQIETRVLTEVLSLPYGLEIYSLLMRFNPLNVERPHARPYNGRNVLVVGLGPAGYTLAHHLASEGFGVVAIDGLKLEPLPKSLTGGWAKAVSAETSVASRQRDLSADASVGRPQRDLSAETRVASPTSISVLSEGDLTSPSAAAQPSPPRGLTTREGDFVPLAPLLGAGEGAEDRAWCAPEAVLDAMSIYKKLDERILLGFGGVSEYGITVRWDKNFLTLVYLSLARNRNVRMYGGIRFGGTMLLEDAWENGFDHVAIAAGAGRPTLIDIKNNLARGIRKASDFLMALQLTGAYKHTSIANLQINLPAVVIGGGLTAIDTATELLAYYLVQIEKTVERYELLEKSLTKEQVARLFDDEEMRQMLEHVEHGRALLAEREAAKREGREPNVQKLLDGWGGVTLVYRKSLQESPAYRLNHEEVAKSLEEGVRYIENLAPTEAVLDERGRVTAMRFGRRDGSSVELPAKTVCVAAGTSPNITYEREHPGTFELDKRGQYFKGYEAFLDDAGKVKLRPADALASGFFTSYQNPEGKTVSFYGDNHPYYAGSVVKAMASAKDGYSHVAALLRPTTDTQPVRDRKLRDLFARLDDELVATVHEVNRLTPTIVEVVIRAPLAARKFHPGQFYRLQNFESRAPIVEGTRLAMEGLALTGAWVDPERGLMGTIVLEMGASSRLCAVLEPGEPVVLMGPTGAPTEIAGKETVLLCGGGLGNAVLFSIARAFRAMGSKVIYFAGYKDGRDVFKRDEIEHYTDQIVWSTDSGAPVEPRRPQDAHFRGNIVQALLAYAEGRLQKPIAKLSEVNRIIAIGSDRMMDAVREARHGVLLPFLDPRHIAIGSINSPMQCMMKEVCAQCLQKHVDPKTGKETVVFTCFNQDQNLDMVDFGHLRQRLRLNSMQEKLSSAFLDHLLKKNPSLLRV